MNIIKNDALAPYSASKMFSIISNVQQYPKFLPWCTNSSIKVINESCVEASMTVDFLGFCYKFTTLNTHFKNDCISMQLINGPFSILDGKWLFKNISTSSCHIFLYVQYELSKNERLVFLKELAFEKFSKMFIEYFIEKARLDEKK